MPAALLSSSSSERSITFNSCTPFQVNRKSLLKLWWEVNFAQHVLVGANGGILSYNIDSWRTLKSETKPSSPQRFFMPLFFQIFVVEFLITLNLGLVRSFRVVQSYSASQGLCTRINHQVKNFTWTGPRKLLIILKWN